MLIEPIAICISLQHYKLGVKNSVLPFSLFFATQKIELLTRL